MTSHGCTRYVHIQQEQYSLWLTLTEQKRPELLMIFLQDTSNCINLFGYMLRNQVKGWSLHLAVCLKIKILFHCFVLLEFLYLILFCRQHGSRCKLNKNK